MKLSRVVSFLCLVVLGLSLLGVSAQAQENQRGVPRLVKFAGHVGQTSRSVQRPDAGIVPASTNVPVTFALYAEQEGGAALWQETQNVGLDAEGRYSVLLGAASREGMPAELFATGEPRWLGVRVNVAGDAEASGEQARVLLVSVPYALRAADAEALGGRAATDFVLREELAGWSGAAAGVPPGPADRPRAVGGAQGVVNATGAVNFMPRVTSINTPSAGDVTYADSQIFDDGTNIRIGNPAVGTGLVNIELTTPSARNAFNSVLRLENATPITGTIVSAMSLTGADRATGNHESFQVARFTLLKNVISTGIATNFDAVFATTSFINQNAPYTVVGWRAEFPRVATGMTLGTYFGLFLEAPLGGGGTVTNAFALVTAPGSGNVGIGTIAPAHLLDVAGNARVSGALRAGQYLDLAGNPVAGTGTVTSVGSGTGLIGGPITGSGSLSLDLMFTDTRYLQLTGGTLTGALNGTSGTFTGTVSGPTGSFSSRLIARGTLEAAALGSATMGTGFNSASQVFFYSAHNGTSALTQDFRWLAEPLGNGMPNPTGRLKLQWGNGVALASDIGLSVASNGVITFAPGQTFPGGGGITQVDTGDGLTGGPITSTGTLAVDSTVARRNATNSFTADQTITGNFTLSGSINNGFRVLPAAGTPNVVGGSSVNVVTMGAVGATIGGGGNSGQPNSVAANYGTVGGGHFNAANGLAATISGGEANVASGILAAIGGGTSNIASGVTATISGGASNQVISNGGTIGGGGGNSVFAGASNATIGGGSSNIASAGANDATIGGGSGNSTSGQAATVSGGNGNSASNANAAVGGGNSNTANGFAATISGGSSNNAGGGNATVGGGQSNNASGSAATIGGGNNNTASNNFGTVGGGNANSAAGILATIGGGTNNTVIGIGGTISGGQSNFANGDFSVVGGGLGNTAGFGVWSVVAGGHLNIASGAYAAVPGGEKNDAAGQFSFAAGRRAKASDDGSFVWGDSTDADVFSVGSNSFTVRANGGVRFHTGAQPFVFLNNALMFPDGTSQTTAFTGGGGGAGRLDISALAINGFRTAAVPSQGLVQGQGGGPLQGWDAVAIPNGSTVAKLRICGRDFGNPDEIRVTLFRKAYSAPAFFFDPPESMAFVGSGGAFFQDALICFETTSITGAVVDNTTYTYYVQVEIVGFAQLVTVQIEY